MTPQNKNDVASTEQSSRLRGSVIHFSLSFLFPSNPFSRGNSVVRIQV